MFDSQNLHHAYVIEGDRESILDRIKKFLEKELKFSTRGNPDFYLAKFNKFGIDEARELIERAGQRPVSGGKKIFVVAFDTITREAQNSLLKVLEDPTEDTYFFMVLPNSERLLPTLLSRVSKIIFDNERGGGSQINSAAASPTSFPSASSFLKSTPSKRLEDIKEMLEELKDEKITKSDLLQFLSEIEKIKTVDISAGMKKEEGKGLEELIKMRSFLQDQSSSAKLIMEYLALTL